MDYKVDKMAVENNRKPKRADVVTSYQKSMNEKVKEKTEEKKNA